MRLPCRAWWCLRRKGCCSPWASRFFLPHTNVCHDNHRQGEFVIDRKFHSLLLRALFIFYLFGFCGLPDLQTASAQVQQDSPSQGPTSRIHERVDDFSRTRLTNNVSPRVQAQYDEGAVEASFKLNNITLVLKPSAAQQNALESLLAEQRDPSSPNYHKWLTPEQYADRFGPSQSDIYQIAGWLGDRGFVITTVSRSRTAIVFTGTAQQVQNAFQTEIHSFQVENQRHFANVSPPSIPAALSDVVGGIRGLDDFRPR